MGKEVDPKSGAAKADPPPEPGILQKLTESVDKLLDRVTKVEERATKSDTQQKKARGFLESLFGEEPEEPKPAA